VLPACGGHCRDISITRVGDISREIRAIDRLALDPRTPAMYRGEAVTHLDLTTPIGREERLVERTAQLATGMTLCNSRDGKSSF